MFTKNYFSVAIERIKPAFLVVPEQYKDLAIELISNSKSQTITHLITVEDIPFASTTELVTKPSLKGAAMLAGRVVSSCKKQAKVKPPEELYVSFDEIYDEKSFEVLTLKQALNIGKKNGYEQKPVSSETTAAVFFNQLPFRTAKMVAISHKQLLINAQQLLTMTYNTSLEANQIIAPDPRCDQQITPAFRQSVETSAGLIISAVIGPRLGWHHVFVSTDDMGSIIELFKKHSINSVVADKIWFEWAVKNAHSLLEYMKRVPLRFSCLSISGTPGRSAYSQWKRDSSQDIHSCYGCLESTAFIFSVPDRWSDYFGIGIPLPWTKVHILEEAPLGRVWKLLGYKQPR